jgi:hypothetical protein
MGYTLPISPRQESIVDAQIHGEHLREVYHDRLGFLPAQHNYPEMTFRVTNNVSEVQVSC